MVAVSALTALAEAAAATLDRGAVVGAWMDAYRRDVFSALFEIGAGTACAIGHLRELDPPSVGDPRAILEQWTGRGTEPAAIAGDGAVLYAGLLDGRARVVSPPPLASFSGRLALARAKAGETIDPAAVQPLYVRRPDVEAARDACRS
jgi:tRNA A37 threonylcarbamoyladenosine modification protein TsaB